MSNNKLWTVISDYSATGEGSTLSGLITYAENEEEARKKFSEHFDFYIPDYACQGINLQDSRTRYLFSKRTLKEAINNEGKCNIHLTAQLHYNFS